MQGIEDVTTPIWRLIFLATAFGPVLAPIISYSLIICGILVITYVFIKAYKKFVIGQNSIEIVELGRETLRRGSTLIINGSKLLNHKETSYQPLSKSTSTSSGDETLQELTFIDKSENLSQSLDELKSILNRDFVKTNFTEAERESLIQADNSFIVSEHRRYNVFKLPESLKWDRVAKLWSSEVLLQCKNIKLSTLFN